MDEFLFDFQIKQMFSETNFKLLHGSTIYKNIAIKMRPFSKKKKGNKNNHSKVIDRKKIKKDFDMTK